VPEPLRARRVFDGAVLKLDLEEWGHGYEVEVVHHPGAAAVLPITQDGHVLLVKQLRPPIRGTLTEIPAGLLDVEGEDALTCAARELREETGYTHDTIEFLGGYYASAGFSDEYVHVFWARTRPEPDGPPEDDLELSTVPLDEIASAARAGKIRDVKTALAILLYASRRGAGTV
jgi:8-oxo-dGTP pyrophosphatase MutT (NUDIX family)